LHLVVDAWCNFGAQCAFGEYRVKHNLDKETIVLRCCSRKWPCWILLDIILLLDIYLAAG